MSHTELSQQESLAKLKEMIEGIRIASLVTLDTEGALHARPMATQEMDAAVAELWFFTTADSAAAAQVQINPQVCVSYAAPEKSRYVSVSGTGELVRERGRIEALWNPLLKAWFPQGLDDPQLALLRVDIRTAQYWDAPSSKLVQLFGLVKAIATGTSAAGSLGENEKLTVRERIGSDTAS